MSANKKYKVFDRRIAVVLIILSIVPQLIRIFLNGFYAYEIEGNINYGVYTEAFFYYGADIMAKFSFFSSLGVMLYLSAKTPFRTGGEWSLLLCAIYMIAYIMFYSLSITYAAVLFIISAAASVFCLFYWFTCHRMPLIMPVISLLLSIVGGIAALYASGVPDTGEIEAYTLYGIMNLGFELLFILFFCLISRALSKRREPSVSGRLISFKDPVMLTAFLSSLAFVLLSAISPTVTVIDSLIEYGPPVNTAEWMSIIGVYAELFIVFVIGYLSMRLSCGITEGEYKRIDEK